MTTTGPEVFDGTFQTTNIWLNEIMADHGGDWQLAWHILGAVLKALRDRLPADLSAHLGAELPLLIRGLYYDQYQPSQQPDVTRSQEALLERVKEGLADIRPLDPAKAAQTISASSPPMSIGRRLATSLSYLKDPASDNLSIAEIAFLSVLTICRPIAALASATGRRRARYAAADGGLRAA